jgi:uncharacterized protein with von Willebrand factor type A (vWA) domain
MKTIVYSRWDGTQTEFRADPDRALDALSDLLMEGLDVREALEWMRRYGFELAGLDMRVMGLEEMIEDLRRQAESLYDRYRMDAATDEIRRRLEELLTREQNALRESQGYESARMNDFLERRHAPAARVSDAIERFRDYAFEDPAAGEEYQDLLAELDRLRDLEDFLREHGSRFRGAEAADYEAAQEVRERIEAIERMARDLAEGNFRELSQGQLRDMLGDPAADSLILLQRFESDMARAGYLREGDAPALTPRAIRRIGAQALAEVYADLRKGRSGGHETAARGVAIPRPDETKPYVFGDPLDLDVVRTLLKAVTRRAAVPGGRNTEKAIALSVDDLEIREFDFSTQATTILLLDMSWSMSWAGRFPAAKRVALAMDHLIRTRFPRDHFFVVGFSTRARELAVHDLPEVCWDMGEPFTNLQEGLMVAERLIVKHPSSSPQIIVITDGQPTAYFRGRELHVEWPMGFGGVSPHAVAETMKQVHRVTRRGITINTFMLDDAPELLGFVEHMTQVNHGRAFFTDPSRLGSFLMVDYLNGRRKRRSR